MTNPFVEKAQKEMGSIERRLYDVQKNLMRGGFG